MEVDGVGAALRGIVEASGRRLGSIVEVTHPATNAAMGGHRDDSSQDPHDRLTNRPAQP